MRKTPLYYRDITGQRFGKWLALERAPNRGNHSFYLCRCDCGVEREVAKVPLEAGKTTNCGCVSKPNLQTFQEHFMKRWTEQDKELVRQWYPFGGSKGLAKKLGRSNQAIISMAKKLKVEFLNTGFNYRPDAWSPEEVEILKQYYPIGGMQACLPYLPRRTKNAINNKAGKLGIYWLQVERRRKAA